MDVLPLSAALCPSFSPMDRDRVPHACVAALLAAGLTSLRAPDALGDLEVLPSLLLRNVVNIPVLFSGLGDLDIFCGDGRGSVGGAWLVPAFALFACTLACCFGTLVSDRRLTMAVGL